MYSLKNCSAMITATQIANFCQLFPGLKIFAQISVEINQLTNLGHRDHRSEFLLSCHLALKIQKVTILWNTKPTWWFGCIVRPRRAQKSQKIQCFGSRIVQRFGTILLRSSLTVVAQTKLGWNSRLKFPSWIIKNKIPIDLRLIDTASRVKMAWCRDL